MNGKAIVFGVVAVVAWAAALWFAFDAFQFQSQSATATGTVVEIEERTSTRRSGSGTRRRTTSYYPTITFQTAEGQSVEFESSTSVDSDVDVGDAIPIRYNRATPSEARLDSFGGMWGLPAGVGFGALVLTFFAGLIALKR